MNDQTFPRRSLLFTPGNSRHKIEKAAASDADTVILDLEDAVAPGRKAEARRTVVAALAEVDFGRRERLIRVNPPGHGFLDDDLVAVMAAVPDGVVAPKVESAAQLEQLDNRLTTAEEGRGMVVGSIRLLALIESARGVTAAAEIAQATARLDCLIFGAEDLAASVGAQRTAEGWEVFYGRSAVVTAAAAYDLAAVDMAFVDLHDLEGLAAEARFGRQLGYQGKIAIHPRQPAVINRAFSPTAAEIEEAQKLLAAYREHLAAGEGVLAYEGRMVDTPLARAAENLLARARRAGLIDNDDPAS